jgi:hypothetical protein
MVVLRYTVLEFALGGCAYTTDTVHSSMVQCVQ